MWQEFGNTVAREKKSLYNQNMLPAGTGSKPAPQGRERKVKVSMTKNQKLVRTAMLAAVTIVLAITPLGYIPVYAIIPILPVTITIMVAPVAIGGLLLGWPSGLVLSLIFGFTSFFRAPLEPLGQLMLANGGLFLVLLATVLPRIPVGLLADLAHKMAAKNPRFQSFWFYSLTGLLASLCNTILFLGFLVLAFDSSVTGLTMNILLSVIFINGAIEAVVNALLVGGISKALLLAKKKKSQ